MAFSSGNHAQGVAAAAKLLGMPAVIVMPSDAPRPKRERTVALGAEVVLYDRAREDREAIARELAERRHAVLVPPYDDPLIIAGQGTTGREIIEDLAALGLVPDIVVVTASGGGLTAGIALAVKARVPRRGSTPPSRKASTITCARSAAVGASRTPRSPARSAMR